MRTSPSTKIQFKEIRNPSAMLGNGGTGGNVYVVTTLKAKLTHPRMSPGMRKLKMTKPLSWGNSAVRETKTDEIARNGKSSAVNNKETPSNATSSTTSPMSGRPQSRQRACSHS